ncbi:MAG: fluoride efflux transporter CrcB [Geobacter sp.]|nr:fluoride efflux transporter CrcB [Geobacter sp.]
MLTVITIAIFGAAGCLARYFLSIWVHDSLGRAFPYGTLCVNIAGAFLIGFVMEFAIRSTHLSANLRTGITIGFLGGLTTFSTFSYETFRLLEDGKFMVAFGNVLVSIVACLIFTFLGIAAVRAL